jgi:hypothetical protein
MTIQFDDLRRVHGGGGRRRFGRLTTALALAAATALVASATGASARADSPGARSSSSYGFDDSLWTSPGLKRPMTLSPLAAWAPQCFAECGPTFGTYVVQRTELFSSDTADLAVNKAADSAGHAVALSGMVITERLDPYGFAADAGSWTDWGVVGERVLDSNGTHSWSLLSSDISLDAHWLPIELYRFEDSSVSMDFAANAPAGVSATPESSTWAMTLIGFAVLGVAGYRSSRNSRRLIDSSIRTCPR